MLRATLTKVKRACTLARFPRILKGEYQLPPCNLEKISTNFTKNQSTTSGSEKPPEEGIENLKVTKIPELRAENVTPDLTRLNTICEKDKEIPTGVIMSHKADSIKDKEEDKLEEKVEITKEPPIFQTFKEEMKDGADLHIDRPTPVLLCKKDQSSGDLNMLEMLAKQTSDAIDNKVLNELGISQQLLTEDITKSTLPNKVGPTGKPKQKTLKPDKISEIDLETRILEKDQTKMKDVIKRREIKHLALPLGVEDISKEITSSESKPSETKIKHRGKNPMDKLADKRQVKIEETQLESDTSLIVEKENVLTSSILTDDRVVLTTAREVPLDSRVRTADEIPIISRPKVKWVSEYGIPVIGREEIISGTDKEATIETTDDNKKLLVGVSLDQDSKIQTEERLNVTKNLFTSLNLVSANTNDSQEKTGTINQPSELDQEETETKCVETSALNAGQTVKMVNDFRVPPHMFNDLRVVTRNLSKDLDLQRAIENFYHQAKETELIKPDRSKYFSYKDDIFEEKDYSQELGSRKEIKDLEIQQKKYIEPYPSYSSYFDYQANLPLNNTSDPFGGLTNPETANNQANTDDIFEEKDYSQELGSRKEIKDLEIQQKKYIEPYPSYSSYFDYQANLPLNNTSDPFGGLKNPETANNQANTDDIFEEKDYSQDLGSRKEIKDLEIQQKKYIEPYPSYSSYFDYQANLPLKNTSDSFGGLKNPETANNQANTDLTPHMMPDVVSTDGKLTENISTNIDEYVRTVNDDAPHITSSTDNSNQENIEPDHKNYTVKFDGDSTEKHHESIRDYFKANITPGIPLEINSFNLNRALIGSILDVIHGSLKHHLKNTIMRDKTREIARFKINNCASLTPMTVQRHWKKAKESCTLAINIVKHPGPWLNKGPVTLRSYHPFLTVDKGCAKYNISSIHSNMTLSEMLKNVRLRAPIELYQKLLMSAPSKKVKQPRGICKDPKPPCPPPPKTCPSAPKVCPKPVCPTPPPPPNPCKPACPNPCNTPKCPPAPKKMPCPCAKCKKVERNTDVLGLVVTLGPPMGMPQASAETYGPLDELPEDVMSNSLFMEEMFLSDALPESIPLTELEDPLMEDVHETEEDFILPDLLHRAFIFPKDYEPWSPIPSWPIPRKEIKKKLVCPKEGCKIRGPPPPGAPCDTIHHPCSGFPNDKKRT